jgi:drug/metabolite transporter (DMT)-like permease
MRPAVHCVLALVQLMFASLAIAGRFVLPRFPAGALVSIRILGATIVLFIVNAVTRRTWVWVARDLWRLAALGMLGIAANQTLFLYGLQHSTAINASILVSTVPVFTVLGSVLTGRESATPLVLVGVVIAALGTVYLIGPDRISLAPDLALGNALIVAGMVCNAAYFLYSKSVVGRYDSITVSFYVMLFASVAVLPFGLSASRNLDVSAVSPAVWGWVIYIVVFPTILTYLLNIWALQRASSNVVAVYIYLQPLFTAAVAPLLLRGEQLTTRALVGGLTIFTGLGLVLWSERRLHREIPVEPVTE